MLIQVEKIRIESTNNNAVIAINVFNASFASNDASSDKAIIRCT